MPLEPGWGLAEAVGLQFLGSPLASWPLAAGAGIWALRLRAGHGAGSTRCFTVRPGRGWFVQQILLREQDAATTNTSQRYLLAAHVPLQCSGTALHLQTQPKRSPCKPPQPQVMLPGCA